MMNMSTSMLKFAVVFWNIFHYSSVTEALRAKKVVNGAPLYTRNMGYQAVRYYAWISDGHECDFPTTGFLKTVSNLNPKLPLHRFGFQCKPNPGRTMCGGALIAPAIVQTACHCLAGFSGSSHVRPAKLKNPWEQLVRIYLGENRIDLMQIGIPSKAFIAHEKCRKMLGFTSHDIGWILLELDKYPNKYPDLRHADIGYAPMYTVKELGKIWLYTMSRRLVCLVIGFGRYKSNVYKKLNDLLHGWIVTVDYTSCYKITNRKGLTEFNYTRDATWSCQIPIIKHYQSQGRGDSGGPITCDNQYLALVSQGVGSVKMEGRSTSMSVNMNIAYAVFQNAIEYRKAFMDIGYAYDMKRRYPVVPAFIPFTNVY